MSEQPPKLQPRTPRTPAAAAAAHAPWKPIEWTPAEALSMQRFAAGTANAVEQKLAFEWLMKVTGMHDEPFRPGGEDGRRETDFALGKAHVGRQIWKLVRINLTRLKGGEHGEHG